MKKYKPVKKYKSEYVDYNDPVSLNYLALAAAILDPDNTNATTSKYIRDLMDEEESEVRYKEIDQIRANGDITESQWISWQQENKEYDEKIRKHLKSYQEKLNRKPPRICPVRVTDQNGEVREFTTIKEFCKEYNFKYENMRIYLTTRAVDGILKYKELTIEKI